MCMYTLLELRQLLALSALDFAYQNGLAPVNLANDLVYHDSRCVSFQLSSFEVVVGSFYRVGAVIFPF